MNLKKLVFSRAKVDSRFTRFTSVFRLKCPSRGHVLWAIPQIYNDLNVHSCKGVFIFRFPGEIYVFFFSVITVIVTFL